MRNVTTFDVGNRAGAKLTPELHEQFVSIVAQTGRISVASGKCGLGVSTARHWMARGRQEESGPYREFLDAVERARSDFLLFANRNLNRLATGGLIRMPSFDKAGNPIRNHKPECGAAPGYPCDCDLVFVEKVVMPNPNVLMWQVDRLDPLPNGGAVPDLPEPRILSDEEKLADTTKGFDLLVEAIQILTSLGVPLEQLLPPDARPAIETTATGAPAEPEPPPPTEQRSSETTSAAEPTDPPKSDPIESF
jgi:hypothetical protein